MPSWKDVQEQREQRRLEEAYKREMRYMAEDLFGESASQEPEQHRYDARKNDMQNFMLGILGPSIDAAREQKEEGSVDVAALQKEQDAFNEQQAVLAEQALEKEIAAGLHPHHRLAQMSEWERKEEYRRNAIDRDQARWERDYEAKQREKRRQKEREAAAKKWEESERYGL